MRINSVLILKVNFIWLIWIILNSLLSSVLRNLFLLISIFYFKLFQLLLQILSYKLKSFVIGFSCLSVTDSTNNSKSVYKLVKWKTVVLRRLWHQQVVYSFLVGGRKQLMIVPKFLIFQNYLFQILKRYYNRVYFTKLAKFEKFNRRNSHAVRAELLKKFYVYHTLFCR